MAREKKPVHSKRQVNVKSVNAPYPVPFLSFEKLR